MICFNTSLITITILVVAICVLPAISYDFKDVRGICNDMLLKFCKFENNINKDLYKDVQSICKKTANNACSTIETKKNTQRRNDSKVEKRNIDDLNTINALNKQITFDKQNGQNALANQYLKTTIRKNNRKRQRTAQSDTRVKKMTLKEYLDDKLKNLESSSNPTIQLYTDVGSSSNPRSSSNTYVGSSSNPRSSSNTYVGKRSNNYLALQPYTDVGSSSNPRSTSNLYVALLSCTNENLDDKLKNLANQYKIYLYDQQRNDQQRNVQGQNVQGQNVPRNGLLGSIIQGQNVQRQNVQGQNVQGQNVQGQNVPRSTKVDDPINEFCLRIINEGNYQNFFSNLLNK